MTGYEHLAGPLTILQFLCTAALCGIIWYVQWVHYPSFPFIDRTRWAAFHRRHTSMTGVIVAPLMLGELGAAVALVLCDAGWRTEAWAWTAHGLLAVIWVSTFLVQVPLHRRLERGFDPVAARRLTLTNAVRTLAWTARVLLLLGPARNSLH